MILLSSSFWCVLYLCSLASDSSHLYVFHENFNFLQKFRCGMAFSSFLSSFLPFFWFFLRCFLSSFLSSLSFSSSFLPSFPTLKNKKNKKTFFRVGKKNGWFLQLRSGKFWKFFCRNEKNEFLLREVRSLFRNRKKHKKSSYSRIIKKNSSIKFFFKNKVRKKNETRIMKKKKREKKSNESTCYQGSFWRSLKSIVVVL